MMMKDAQGLPFVGRAASFLLTHAPVVSGEYANLRAEERFKKALDHRMLARIDATSSWRHNHSKSVLEGWLLEAGYEGRLDYSAPIYPRHRGDQIAIFLQHHRELTGSEPVYAILDDEFTDEEKQQHPGAVVATTYQHGLTAELADRVIELLKGGPR